MLPIQKKEKVDSSDLTEITEHIILKAFTKEDDEIGKHIVLYAGFSDEDAIGLSIHPLVSKKLIDKLKEKNLF